MEQKGIQTWARILLFICGLALIAVLFVPIWRIDLDAPQYPEGLRLLIFADNLGGNVDIINGLNHYIGMKTLHASDFIEFTVLKYIIIFFALAFCITSVIGKRKFLYLLFILFVAFGVLAMVDFWRWEYNYGHNLDPNAAIIVPGMAYQPPLIGFKQLLNFGAYSVPDIGGWIFVAVGAIILMLVIIEWRAARNSVKSKPVMAMIISLSMLALSSCAQKPKPIHYGSDQCSFCKMTISDNRFGAQLITSKGKIYNFDDIHCLQTYLGAQAATLSGKEHIYFTNFCSDHSLIASQDAYLLKSSELKSPMGGNLAAFNQPDSLQKMKDFYHGSSISWTDIKPK